MRVRLVVAVIAISAVVFFAINTGDESPDTDGASNTGVGSAETRQPDPNPTLLTAGQSRAAEAAGDFQEPTKQEDPSGGYAPLAVPVVRAVEPPPPPASPSAESMYSKTTLLRLVKAKPTRTVWNDAPLPEVLEQLSEQAGVAIALGSDAASRAAKIKIADPLAGVEGSSDATIWSILDALASAHEFTVSVGPESVMLLDARKDTKPRLRYFDAKGLIDNEWGAKKEIEKVDRLDAVLPDLLRTAAKVSADESGRGMIELHNGILVARQPPPVLKRIGEVLDRWRAEPTALREAYDGLMAQRHPTVSGAPPRRGGGGGGDTPARDGKRR